MPHDITSAFRRAASTIPNGQLRAEESFTLHDSIGAIELMDPKMDSGFIPPGTSEQEFDFEANLSWQEVLAITAELLGFFALWHQGFSVFQTFLTSRHVDNLLQKDAHRLEHIQFTTPKGTNVKNTEPGLEIIRLTSITLIFILGCNIDDIKQSEAPIWEEEDMSCQSYGLTFFSRVSPQSLADEISNFISQFCSFESYTKPQKLFMEQLLGFLIDLLIANTHMNPTIRSDNWKEAEDRHDTIFRYYKSSLQNEYGQNAFSTSIQNHYASSAPLQARLHPTIDQSWNTYRTFLHSLNSSIGHRTEYSKMTGSNLMYTTRYITENIFDEAETEFAYIRIVMSKLLWEKTAPDRLKDELFREYLDEDATLLDVWPTSYTVETFDALQNKVQTGFENGKSDPRTVLTWQLLIFINRVTESDDAYSDIIKAQWTNRSRCRRMYSHIIKGLQAIHTETRNTDRILAQQMLWVGFTPLTNWLKSLESEIQMQYFIIGLELNLFENYEIPIAYWAISSIGTQLKGYGSLARKESHVVNALDATTYVARAFFFAWICLIELGIVTLPTDISSHHFSNNWALRASPFSQKQHPILTSWPLVSKIFSFDNLHLFVNFRLAEEKHIMGKRGRTNYDRKNAMQIEHRRDLLLTQANIMASMAEESYRTQIAKSPEVVNFFLRKGRMGASLKEFQVFLDQVSNLSPEDCASWEVEPDEAIILRPSKKLEGLPWLIIPKLRRKRIDGVEVKAS